MVYGGACCLEGVVLDIDTTTWVPETMNGISGVPTYKSSEVCKDWSLDRVYRLDLGSYPTRIKIIESHGGFQYVFFIP